MVLVSESMEEPLKAFFEETLPTITDAEMDILIQYIMALLTNTNEGSEEDLKAECKENLRDFLTENTDAFVDLMFKKIIELKKAEEEAEKATREMFKRNRRVVTRTKEDDSDGSVERFTGNIKTTTSKSGKREIRTRRGAPKRSRSRSYETKKKVKKRKHERKKRKRDKESSTSSSKEASASNPLAKLFTPLFQPFNSIRGSKESSKKLKETANTTLEKLLRLNYEQVIKQQASMALQRQPNLQDQLNLAAVAALQKPEKIDLEAFQKQQYLQSRQPKKAVKITPNRRHRSSRVTSTPIQTFSPEVEVPETQEIRTTPVYEPLFPEQPNRNNNNNNNNRRGVKRPFDQPYNNQNNWKRQRYQGNQNINSNKINIQPKRNKQVRQLYLKNIPPALNSIAKLSTYFSEYGEVEHVQVHKETNKAFVQFETVEAAQLAFDNGQLKPVLDNKEIQVLWAHYNRMSRLQNNNNNNNNFHNNNNNNNAMDARQRRFNFPGNNTSNNPQWSKNHPQHQPPRNSFHQPHATAYEKPTFRHRAMQRNILNSFANEEFEDSHSNSAQDEELPPRPALPKAYTTPTIFAPSFATFEVSDAKDALKQYETNLENINEELQKIQSRIKETIKIADALNEKTSDAAKELKKRCGDNLKKFTTHFELLIKKKRTAVLLKQKAERKLQTSKLNPVTLQKSQLDRDLDLYNAHGRKQATHKVLDLRPALIKVKNLHEKMSEVILKAFFQNYGKVVSVEIVKVNNAREAYVRFSDRQQAEQAVSQAQTWKDFQGATWEFKLELIDKIPTINQDDTELEHAFDTDN